MLKLNKREREKENCHHLKIHLKIWIVSICFYNMLMNIYFVRLGKKCGKVWWCCCCCCCGGMKTVIYCILSATAMQNSTIGICCTLLELDAKQQPRKTYEMKVRKRSQVMELSWVDVFPLSFEIDVLKLERSLAKKNDSITSDCER